MSAVAPLGWTIARLLRNDVRLVLRDRMLIVLLGVAAALGFAARFALPAIDASLRASGSMPGEGIPDPFSATFPMWVAFIGLWQAALMPGTAFAFLLLDEKEDGSLLAMRVTPVPFTRYVGYRLALPASLAFFFALVIPSAIGLSPVPLWQAPLFALGAAITAPLATCLIATYAKDKVQGLAFTKFGGVAGLTILIGWFLPESWQWALGVFPPFLIAKARWMSAAGASNWWAPLAVGILSQAFLLRLLVRRFRPG